MRIDKINIKKGSNIYTLSQESLSHLVNKYTGKKIGWYGTSIPRGGDEQISYANYACNNLGAVCFNHSIGSGLMKTFKSDGSRIDGKWNKTKCFSMTLDEINNEFGSNPINLNTALSQSYETTLIPNANEYDLFVFDYGANDCEIDKISNDGWEERSDFIKFDKNDPRNPSKFPIYSRERSSFIGATNYVIDKLLEKNPRARFCFISHFSLDDLQYNSSQHRKLINLQEAIADYWEVPLCRFYKKTGWVYKDGINTLELYCPDGIHPHSDPTGEAVDILTDITTNFLLTEVS